MTDKTYNGWTNYATWRVNLEIFDGFDPSDYYSDFDPENVYGLAENLRQYAEDAIFVNSAPSLMEDYARAFLENVEWSEIAHHMIADYIMDNA